MTEVAVASSSSSSSRTDLLESLERHNATFTKLLSLIPARYYIQPDAEELDSKWMKNKKRKTGEEIKEHKRKAKAEKLDPANNLTTDQILAQNQPSTPGVDGAGPSTLTMAPMPPRSSITDLRAKLANRLEQFRRDRGEPESRDELEMAQRARRGEMRDKRRKERKEERRKARVEPTAKTAKTQLIVPALPSGRHDSDSVTYPSLSLPNSGNRSKAPLRNLSNPAQALAHLTKHNNQIAGLPEEKRKEIEEKERWAKAEERARGGKVADEEKTLKKAVKRLEKTKSKSGHEWSERKKHLEHSQNAAVKKRNDNIASRADARKNKRLGIKDKSKGKDKGKTGGGGYKGKKKRPGFEGGRQEWKGKGKDKA